MVVSWAGAEGREFDKHERIVQESCSTGLWEVIVLYSSSCIACIFAGDRRSIR